MLIACSVSIASRSTASMLSSWCVLLFSTMCIRLGCRFLVCCSCLFVVFGLVVSFVVR